MSTGQPAPKSPRPPGCKTAKAGSAAKRDLTTMLTAHISEQKTKSQEQMVLYKDAIDRQAENQKVLSDAIGVLCNNMRRRNYPVDSAVARAGEELEIAEMAMKKEEMEMKRAEFALRKEENRRRLLVLLETEESTPAAAPPVAASPVAAPPAVAPPAVPTAARHSSVVLTNPPRRR